MAHKANLRCPNCVRILPRKLPQLNEGLPWLLDVAQLSHSGQQIFRCPYCALVWRQSVGPVTGVEVTALGLYRSDSNRLQCLPTGFKPVFHKPEQTPPLPDRKSTRLNSSHA